MVLNFDHGPDTLPTSSEVRNTHDGRLKAPSAMASTQSKTAHLTQESLLMLSFPSFSLLVTASSPWNSMSSSELASPRAWRSPPEEDDVTTSSTFSMPANVPAPVVVVYPFPPSPSPSFF